MSEFLDLREEKRRMAQERQDAKDKARRAVELATPEDVLLARSAPLTEIVPRPETPEDVLLAQYAAVNTVPTKSETT